jgi:hypothetical protein
MKIRLALLILAIASPKLEAGLDTILTIPDVDLTDVTFTAIQPIACPYITTPTSAGLVNIYFAEKTPKEVNELLPLEQAFVSIRKVQADGGIGFATAKLSGEKGSYEVFLDYIKYRDETTTDSKKRVRVGVGARIIARVTTKKVNLDLGSIFAIGLAFKAGSIEGQVEVLKIGIDSEKVSALMPPPSDLSDTALQNAMQAAATIRAMLYDPNTKLTPFIIAVGKPKPSTLPDR